MSEKECNRFVLAACLVLLAMAAAVLLCGCTPAASAPVPFVPAPRRVKTRADGRPWLDGRYEIRWYGSKGSCVIRPEGGWENTEQGGGRWIGFWEVKGDCITVNEAVVPLLPLPTADRGPPSWFRWSAVLEKGRWKGRTTHGGEFEILLPSEGK